MTKPTDWQHTEFAEDGLPDEGESKGAEPVQLGKWEADGIYARIQKARENAPTYVLHDGPPYPTGAIHLGTALNKILKDIVVKSMTMAGDFVRHMCRDGIATDCRLKRRWKKNLEAKGL